MARIEIKGMTWGHRRAIAPLVASAEEFSSSNPDVAIEWQVRSLSAFEHQPFDQAVRESDLIVYDHPHCGTVARHGLLAPLDSVLAQTAGALLPSSYIGPSLESYQYSGKTWAAPVDGATIHAMYRHELLKWVQDSVPASWEDVIKLGERARSKGLRIVMAAYGHHAVLTLVSLCANLGARWSEDKTPERAVLKEAVELFERALAVSDREVSLASQAIQIHELLVKSDSYAYCPAAYGYATYGEQGDNRLSFAAFPGPNGPGGTVVGGAGVGITAHSREKEAARRYVQFLATASTQLMFASHSGQPARIDAWTEQAADERFYGFFSAIKSTMEASLVRPRFAGYSKAEQGLSEALQRRLRGHTSEEQLLDEFQRIFFDSIE